MAPGTIEHWTYVNGGGGAYVNHCHNTVHEDFALLMRIQLLNGFTGTPQAIVTRTPNPSPSGVTYTDPEVLPEAPDFA